MSSWHTFTRGENSPMAVHLPRIQAYHADTSQGGTMLILEKDVSLWVSCGPAEVAAALDRAVAEDNLRAYERVLAEKQALEAELAERDDLALERSERDGQ